MATVKTIHSAVRACETIGLRVQGKMQVKWQTWFSCPKGSSKAVTSRTQNFPLWNTTNVNLSDLWELQSQINQVCHIIHILQNTLWSQNKQVNPLYTDGVTVISPRISAGVFWGWLSFYRLLEPWSETRHGIQVQLPTHPIHVRLNASIFVCVISQSMYVSNERSCVNWA